MSRKWIVAGAALIAGVISLSAATPALANSSQRPFRATLTETLSVEGPLSGSGNATHMGKVSDSGSLSVDKSNFPVSLVFSATGTLTAANGDEVFFSYVVTQTDTASPPQGMNYDESGNYTITGGTGRFAGATGSGTISGTCVSSFTSTIGTCNDTWTGTIGY